MKTIIRFNVRQIIAMPVVIVCFLAILLGFVMYSVITYASGIKCINFVIQFDYFTYLELVLTLIVFCYGVYVYQYSSTVEEMSLFSRAQIQVGRMISVLLVSLSFCLFPASFVVISAIISRSDARFTLDALLYTTIRWLLLLGGAEILAMISSFFLKTKAAYILCVPSTIVLSYLNKGLFAVLSSRHADELSAFFSMQRMGIGSIMIDYATPRIDLFLVVKLLYVIIGIAIVLLLVWMILAPQKKRSVFAFILLLALESGCIWGWFQLYPQQYQYKEKLYEMPVCSQDIRIKEYSGEIILGELTKFHCKVYFHPTRENEVMLRLDECFTIDEITYGQEPLTYRRSGDYIEIDLPENLSEDVALLLDYHGRIYYASAVGTINIFATRTSAALPARFAFLPIIDEDIGEKRYNLMIRASNTLISNLDVTPIERDLYSVKGNACSCSLFSGYLTQFEMDGITFYRAKYNQITDYEEVYRNALQYRWFDPYASALRDDEYKTPKKVFMIYSLYGVIGFPIVYDEYMLLNYGYPTS